MNYSPIYPVRARGNAAAHQASLSVIGYAASDIHAGDTFEANVGSGPNAALPSTLPTTVLEVFQAISDPLNIAGQMAVQARSVTSGAQRYVAVSQITRKISGAGDNTEPSTGTMALIAAYELLSVAGTVTGAYHGYKRNNSVGWAIGWGLLGGLFPYITIPVSIAQGFGKKKGRR